MTYNGNESNLRTIDKFIVLMEEIAVLQSRYKESATGDLRTTVNVLQNRIKELKERVHD